MNIQESSVHPGARQGQPFTGLGQESFLHSGLSFEMRGQLFSGPKAQRAKAVGIDSNKSVGKRYLSIVTYSTVMFVHWSMAVFIANIII
jgi:hypothetical protein